MTATTFPKPKVYIAGPDIFSLKWPEISSAIVQASEDLGMTPLFPFTPGATMDVLGFAGISAVGTREDAAEAREHCLSQLRSCDAVIANITPFRGDEPDSGTVAEIITAHEWGKPVVAYTHDPRMTDQRHDLRSRTTNNGSMVCNDGFLVERYNLPCNIMVAGACDKLIVGDAHDALTVVKGLLILNRSNISQ